MFCYRSSSHNVSFKTWQIACTAVAEHEAPVILSDPAYITALSCSHIGPHFDVQLISERKLKEHGIKDNYNRGGLRAMGWRWRNCCVFLVGLFAFWRSSLYLPMSTHCQQRKCAVVYLDQMYKNIFGMPQHFCRNRVKIDSLIMDSIL